MPQTPKIARPADKVRPANQLAVKAAHVPDPVPGRYFASLKKWKKNRDPSRMPCL